MKLRYGIFIASFVINMQSFGLGVEVGPVGAGIGPRGVGLAVDDPECVRCKYGAVCPAACYENDGVFLGIRGDRRRYKTYEEEQRERAAERGEKVY